MNITAKLYQRLSDLEKIGRSISDHRHQNMPIPSCVWSDLYRQINAARDVLHEAQPNEPALSAAERTSLVNSLSGALLMIPGSYPSPEAAAEGLMKRLDHDGWVIQRKWPASGEE